jgi:hypothetical protein
MRNLRIHNRLLVFWKKDIHVTILCRFSKMSLKRSKKNSYKKLFQNFCKMLFHVYFIHEKENYTLFSIGKAINVYKRRQTMQTAQNAELLIYQHMTFSTEEEAAKKEAVLKGRFSSSKMMGDWFKITKDQIDQAMEEYWIEMNVAEDYASPKPSTANNNDPKQEIPKKEESNPQCDPKIAKPHMFGNVDMSKPHIFGTFQFGSNIYEYVPPLVGVVRRMKSEYPLHFGSSCNCFDFEFKEFVKKYADRNHIFLSSDEAYKTGWKSLLADEGLRFQKTTLKGKNVFRIHGFEIPLM